MTLRYWLHYCFILNMWYKKLLSSLLLEVVGRWVSLSRMCPILLLDFYLWVNPDPIVRRTGINSFRVNRNYAQARFLCSHSVRLKSITIIISWLDVKCEGEATQSCCPISISISDPNLYSNLKSRFTHKEHDTINHNVINTQIPQLHNVHSQCVEWKGISITLI